MKRISVAEPKLAGNERKYVLDCLDSTWISSVGKYITAFEESFASYCGVKHAIATNNGTTALHLALVALEVGRGDEVIVPTVTYIATANAVSYCGATPVFVDVEPGTMNIDPDQVERLITPRTKGIIPVHLYGHPANMQPLMEVARKHRLFVLEDAAEAHGAACYGRKVGGFGECAVFSFFGNKIVTTGEGGMITTDDDKLAEKLRLLRGQGMDPKRRYWFPVIGYNYRMTNIQAAIGLAQMETIQAAIDDRAKIASAYTAQLEKLSSHYILPQEASWAKPVYWMYTIFVAGSIANQRDAVMAVLDAHNIETRPSFYPMHVLPPYLQNVAFPVADDWALRGINLPTHQLLTRDDIDRVVVALTTATKIA